ncbi:uncharacterized protein [Centruroides vittatus]|uniref:uncharacterized protein LOC111629882 isoform X2 n=1 Tax=Centruroides sculpturatus TaxID=218467 RepID=UPI000C6E9F0A|nr:uncharacterized protein LOC111629882 isoform X2 [Centruroides sculpturatus]
MFIEECKAKWKSIRDKYVKLQNKSCKSGSANPETSWELYPILSFLQDHVKHKPSNADPNNSLSAGQDDDQIDDMECDSLDTHISDEEEDEDDKETDPNKRKRNPKGLLRAMLRKKKRMDDVDYFCHSLAERLKKLDGKKKSFLMARFQVMLHEAEFDDSVA